MSTPRPALRRALISLLVGALLGAGAPAYALDDIPTAADVAAAEAAAATSAQSVAEVRDRLASAEARLTAATIYAATKAEEYNGARYHLSSAKKEARATEAAAVAARADVQQQAARYSEAVVTSYQMAPELTAWASVMSSDGLGQAVERSATLQVAEDAMSTRYDALAIAKARAERAEAKAAAARDRAAALASKARVARNLAVAAQQSAASAMADIAAERQELISRWAELQGISVALAEQRNNALEQQAAEEAAAQEEAQDDEEAAPTGSSGSGSGAGSGSGSGAGNGGGGGGGNGGGSVSPDPSPSQPASPSPTPSGSPSSPPSPTPTPTPPPNPPPVSGGADRAIAFARAQIGEPYRWGAAGPNAWDCSGLTQGAWGAAGKYLPHYSVAQFEQSTQISKSQLQPGDLLFWTSNGRSSGIYHVALYIGNSRMIHAPRTGRPVAEESMYYWVAPTLFARP
ncbi:MAG: C40 family peptidase [Nocardioides sp.]